MTSRLPLLFPGILLVIFASAFFVPQHSGKADASRQDTAYITSTEVLQREDIPDSVFAMTQLRVLSISGMDCDYVIIDKSGNPVKDCWMIRSIPPAIGQLKKLHTLRITLGSFSELPKEIAELQQLRSVDFTDGVLTNVDGLAGLENLDELYLYGCHLKTLPADLSHWKKLKHLGLTGNPYISDAEKARVKAALPGCEIVF